jgi:glycerol-3-phosphate dehydrogenase
MKRTPIIQQTLARKKPFDVIIVGGGATGLGAAVEAASRGHETLLVEQADFAKGTSGRSTKLVHGGVRYLQQGNVSLVLEALRERGRLYRNAPHLVHDMAFVIPSYHWWQKPFYGVGMKVYDALAGKLGLSPSRILSRAKTIQALPTLRTEGLSGGVEYHDGQFDDSRLAVNLAQTAVEQGAAVLNYVKCTGLIKTGSRVTGIQARDELSGENFEIAGKTIINATGVFVDEMIEYDTDSPSRIVAVSQGIHLVLPKRFQPGKAALMIPKTEDGRVLFGVPWHEHVVVGTTDTPRPFRSLEPRALEEEREFVLSHARKYLQTEPTEADVLSVFAGLRPLVQSNKGSNTAALSRDHTILIGKSGLITITGGKWTTYRKMGEDVVTQAEKIGELKQRASVTTELPIHGWTKSADPEEHLAVYGSDAAAIRSLMGESPELKEKIHPDFPYQKAEVIWQAREEMAQTVEDVLARRTRALVLNAKSSMEAAPEVARLLAKEFAFSQQWVDGQIENYSQLARRYVYSDPMSIGRKSDEKEPAILNA